jgi:PAS domain S-box-containing protein
MSIPQTIAPHPHDTSRTLERALLESAFNTMSEGLAVQGVDGRVVRANQAAADILGLSLDQLLGLTSVDPRWQSVYPDGSPWAGQDHPAMIALRTGQVQREKIMGIQAAGRGQRWISINACPMFDESGRTITGALATFVDVTDRLNLQARLQHTTAQLQDLYDNAPCAYHMLDAKGKYLRINATGLAWIGCTREEVIGCLSPADFFSPHSQATFRENFPRIKAGGSLNGLEVDLISRTGVKRRVSVNASGIFDDDGHFVATRSVMFDVTETSRMREALHQLTAEQHAMLDNDLIGMVKLRQRLSIWSNRALDRIFGYQEGELHGQPSRLIYLDDDSHRALGEAAYPTLQAGGIYRTQMRMRRKDGSAVWIDLSGMMLSPQQGESMWMMVDISAQKQAEEERLLAITMAEQNRQLVESNRLKNQFLANMSHELRTPLNAVIGFSQLLQSGALSANNPKTSSYLKQIEISGQHLLQLIETMLDFASVESGKMLFQPQALRLSDVVGEVVNMLHAKCQSYGVQIVFQVDADAELVYLDPMRLRQVLLNYIGNAVKFSHRGGLVQVQASACGPRDVRIEVHDQGIGIAAEQIPGLFAQFHQISQGATKQFEGTGMGLAVVRRLVEAQGGTVGVQSRLGHGSLFHLVLPRGC